MLHEQVSLIQHSFELQVVSARVFEKHCPLLAGLALETHARRNDELDVMLAESRCEPVKFSDR